MNNKLLETKALLTGDIVAFYVKIEIVLNIIQCIPSLSCRAL